MSSLRLAFIIDAVDRATATVNRVNKTVDRLTEPARRVRASFNGLLDASRFERVRSAMGELGDRTNGVLGWARGVTTAVAGVGIAAGGAGFALKRTIDQVDQMLDQAKKLHVPIEMYQRLGYAAQMNGSNQDEMGQALQFLSQNMIAAINGSSEMVTWFARVGITLDQLKNMNAVQVFEAIADRFNKVGDAGQNAEKKIALMRAMMGRGGAELKQTLDLGSAGLRRFYEEADRLGAVVGSDAAEAMGDFNDEFDRMQISAAGVMRAIASTALPVLNELVKRTTAWTVANRALIATRVGEFIDQVVPRLPAIVTSLGQIAAGLAAVIAGADRFAQALGGWEVVIALVSGLIIGKGLVALYGMATALWAVGAAFLATPFGWFAAGVAGVVALAGLIYAKWEPIKKFFGDIADSFTKAGSAAAWLGGLVSRAGSGIAGAFNFSTAGTTMAEDRPSILSTMFAPGPALPSANARGGRQDLGGTLRIELDSTGQPRVRELRQAPGSPLEFDVYSGSHLVPQ